MTFKGELYTFGFAYPELEIQWIFQVVMFMRHWLSRETLRQYLPESLGYPYFALKTFFLFLIITLVKILFCFLNSIQMLPLIVFVDCPQMGSAL